MFTKLNKWLNNLLAAQTQVLEIANKMDLDRKYQESLNSTKGK